MEYEELFTVHGVVYRSFHRWEIYVPLWSMFYACELELPFMCYSVFRSVRHRHRYRHHHRHRLCFCSVYRNIAVHLVHFAADWQSRRFNINQMNGWICKFNRVAIIVFVLVQSTVFFQTGSPYDGAGIQSGPTIFERSNYSHGAR